MQLAGEKVIVTGAAIRVGREIALEMARAGADLILHYRESSEAAEKTAKEIGALGRSAILAKGDLSDPGELLRVSELAREAAVLVNSASIFPRTPLPEVTIEAWDEVFAVNLRAPFFLARNLGLQMKKRGRGVIVNVADWAALRPHRSYLPYCISKAGLVSVTTGLARVLAPQVRVNTVAPGPVMFPTGMSEEERETIRRRTPLQREGTPGDVARAVRFLVEGSDFVTGAFLTVDGGRLIA